MWKTARAALEYYVGITLPDLGVPRDANNAPIKELAAPVIAQILAGTHPDYTSVLACARRDRDKVWPPSAESAHILLGGKRHLYLLAPHSTP